MEPRILLFDEPLSNLDAKLRVQMRSEIRGLQRRMDITSVYVTHDQIEAMALSDRIVVMNKGKIEQIGTPSEIYRWPASRFVADFIGRANFIEASVDPKSNGQVVVQVLGRTCHTSLRFDYHAGMKTTAMLRPEALRLLEDSTLQQVTVEQAMYLGSEVEYIVYWGENRLVVVEQDPRFQQIYQEGQTVGIDFIDEAVHMLPGD